MQCEFCELNILADNIDLEEQSATCNYCKQTFIFLTEFPLARPQSLSIIESGSERSIEWRWLHFTVLFSITFTIAAIGFAVAWFAGLLFGWVDNPPDEHAMLYLMGLVPLTFGIYLFYGDLMSFLNKSQITVDEQSLRKHHSPLPWPGSVTVDRREITRLVCKRESIQNDNTTYLLYSLIVIRNNLPPVPLIHHALLNKADRPILQNGGRPNRANVLWVKQQLEQWLNLSSKALSG